MIYKLKVGDKVRPRTKNELSKDDHPVLLHEWYKVSMNQTYTIKTTEDDESYLLNANPFIWEREWLIKCDIFDEDLFHV